MVNCIVFEVKVGNLSLKFEKAKPVSIVKEVLPFLF